MSNAHHIHTAAHVLLHTQAGKQALATTGAALAVAAPVVVPVAIAAGAVYGISKLFK